MTRLSDLQAMDWAWIGREGLDAAAATLATTLQERLPASVPAEAIERASHGDDRASIMTTHAGLRHAELGSVGAPPQPLLTPTAQDRTGAFLAMSGYVRGALR